MSDVSSRISGTSPGQRRLNGPQTSGREYRNLSEPIHGAPVLPCREAVAVPIGQDVQYRIPLVPNARRFKAGHRIRLHLTSDDQDPKAPAIMGFRHATVGTSTINSIRSESRLHLPVLPKPVP